MIFDECVFEWKWVKTKNIRSNEMEKLNLSADIREIISNDANDLFQELIWSYFGKTFISNRQQSTLRQCPHASNSWCYLAHQLSLPASWWTFFTWTSHERF